MNKPFQFCQPVRVVFGNGEIEKLPVETKKFGKSALIVTTKKLKEIGIIRRIDTLLSQLKIKTSVFCDVNPDPKCSEVDAAARRLRSLSPEVLIGVGGGSAMDFAKALSIAMTHHRAIWNYVNLSNRPPLKISKRTIPIILIPTTSGTGSEMTPYCVLINTDTNQKATIKSGKIYSRTSIIDPELTLSLPSRLTASTGVDAFTHALESLLNVKNSTPFSDMVSDEAIRIITAVLPRALKNGKNREARRSLAWASTLAGMAIAQAGTTVIHAIAQPLSARTRLSHSLAVAIFIIPVLKYTYLYDIKRFTKIAALINSRGESGKSDRKRAADSIEYITEFLKKVGMFYRMRDFQISEDIIDLLVKDTTTYMSRPLAQHPRRFSKNEIRKICREAF